MAHGVQFSGYYTLGARFNRKALTDEFNQAVAAGQIPKPADDEKSIAKAQKAFMKDRIFKEQEKVWTAFTQALTQIEKRTNQPVLSFSDYEFIDDQNLDWGLNVVCEDQYDAAFEQGVQGVAQQPGYQCVQLTRHDTQPIDTKIHQGFVENLKSAVRVGSLERVSTLDVLQAVFKALISKA